MNTRNETNDAPKGMRVQIFTSKQLTADYSNGGISATCKAVTIVGDGVPQIIRADEDAPAVVLCSRNNYVYAEPLEPRQPGNVGWMDGGALLYTHDSRWHELVGHEYPICLHDRQETPAQYRNLSK